MRASSVITPRKAASSFSFVAVWMASIRFPTDATGAVPTPAAAASIGPTSSPARALRNSRSKREASTVTATRTSAPSAVRCVVPTASGPPAVTTARSIVSNSARLSSASRDAVSESQKYTPSVPWPSSRATAADATGPVACSCRARRCRPCNGTWLVASSGTRVSGTPDANTSAAAVGSTQMLNSACGFSKAFPATSTALPIEYTMAMLPTIPGSRRSAAARLVSGPSVNTTTGSGEAEISDTSSSGAPSSDGAPPTGNSTPNRSSAAARHSAGNAFSPAKGASGPHATGTSSPPASSTNPKACRTPAAQCTNPVPDTVTDNTSRSGRPNR